MTVGEIIARMVQRLDAALASELDPERRRRVQIAVGYLHLAAYWLGSTGAPRDGAPPSGRHERLP